MVTRRLHCRLDGVGNQLHDHLGTSGGGTVEYRGSVSAGERAAAVYTPATLTSGEPTGGVRRIRIGVGQEGWVGQWHRLKTSRPLVMILAAG